MVAEWELSGPFRRMENRTLPRFGATPDWERPSSRPAGHSLTALRSDSTKELGLSGEIRKVVS